MFTLSDLEAENLDVQTTALRDPYNLKGLQGIVTTGDDME